MKRLPKLTPAYCLVALIAIIALSCDIYQPQESFTFAVPKNDVLYNTMFANVKALLEQNGYEIERVDVELNVDAQRMVSQGKADLAFINNVSSHIVEELGPESARLRTILPLARRALLGFSRDTITGRPEREVFENKTVGVELLHGEGHGNIAALFSRAHVANPKFVQSNLSKFDVRLIWGTPYGKRATAMLDSGWHAISFSNEWIEFLTLTNPALKPVMLPPIPGDPHSRSIHTFATDAVLVTHEGTGEKAIYNLVETIIQGKLSLVREDPMYLSITENIDRETLLYPMHEGTSSYLRRDKPTFLERYADPLALVLSISVVLFGLAQTVKSRMMQIKKDKIDEYFLEFLDIRSEKKLSAQNQRDKMNDLFQRSLLQMTNDKMDKNDFNILARLIQQELTNLQLHE